MTDDAMRPPRLPHDDPELEPMLPGSTVEEQIARWMELSRRLGSALAEMVHMMPGVLARLDEHDAHLKTHDSQIEDIRGGNSVAGVLAEIKQLHARMMAIEAKLPREAT